MTNFSTNILKNLPLLTLESNAMEDEVAMFFKTVIEDLI